MIFLLLIFLLLTTNSQAANVAMCDATKGTVKNYLISVNTPDYSTDSNNIINPQEETLLLNVPYKFLKCINGHIVEMTQVEKDIVLQAEVDALKQQQINDVNALNITAIDLAKALVALNIVDGPTLKAKIKQIRGLQ